MADSVGSSAAAPAPAAATIDAAAREAKDNKDGGELVENRDFVYETVQGGECVLGGVGVGKGSFFGTLSRARESLRMGKKGRLFGQGRVVFKYFTSVRKVKPEDRNKCLYYMLVQCQWLFPPELTLLLNAPKREQKEEKARDPRRWRALRWKTKTLLRLTK